jgi:hypothetical protein
MTTNYCGGKTRAGTPCKRPAGWGTDHPGSGRCKLHGGATKRGAEHPRFKHGRYSKYVQAALSEKAAQFKYGDVLNLADELALTRALLADWLERFDSMDVQAIGVTRALIDDTRKLIETIAKIRNQTALTQAEVAYIAARIPDIVSQYVQEPDAQQRFIAELFGVTGHRASSPRQLESASEHDGNA